ncbi:MAG TPA: 5-carboxymethyl-2-hydroxymuconate isomerase, partial [Verrucomicrobiae bacterium]|nr:5-carboxymethyl-2-hydroxymuconate isomerase [Verrucomicrobiae bacterium]
MKIIRYLDPSGKIFYGAELAAGKTARIEGDIFASFKATTEPAQISKLLAPVVPAATLCSGLN